MHRHEALIRRYFAACNAADHAALVGCFTADAVHYFPPGLPDIPWRGAGTIADKWVWCVEQLGSQWTIEKVLVSADSDEAVIEWTHWKRMAGTAQRGDEWYLFDADSGLIKEIRAYYAAPAVKDAPIGELVGFDYAARDYHLAPPGSLALHARPEALLAGPSKSAQVDLEPWPAPPRGGKLDQGPKT